MATILTGCSQVTGGLEVSSTDSRTTAFGNVEVLAVVENTSGDTKSGTLQTQVDIQGGDTYTERENITVMGESSNSYTITHDVGLGDSLSAESYEYSAEIL